MRRSRVPQYSIREASLARDLPSIRQLWLAHLTTSRQRLAADYDIHLPVEIAVEHDVATIAKFQAPTGRILVAVQGDTMVGTGSFRRIGADVAEIKRMYVEPAHRGAGLGRLLLNGLLQTAKDSGYRSMKLETAPFRVPALSLYRSAGFVVTEPYPETEIPRQYWDRWVFMQLEHL